VSLALLLAALLAVACVLAVALPFLREPDPATDELDDLTQGELRIVALEEERDRALAALKELEADHRAGKISDDDYRAVVGGLRRDAASALRSLDEAHGGADAAGAGTTERVTNNA
jgi:hypothetical protein